MTATHAGTPEEDDDVAKRAVLREAIASEFGLPEVTPEWAAAFHEILDVARQQSGLDLAGYKAVPILRKIRRRMEKRGLQTLIEYEACLRVDQTEVDALTRSIPTHVTEFFRDPLVWEELRKHVITPLLDSSRAKEPTRAWTAACATGEEAFSLAMLLAESADASMSPHSFQIFATDVAPEIVATASRGMFNAGAMGGVSVERRHRFFRAIKDGYQVDQALRNRMIFAPQHLLSDPPFGNLDLVTCRNMLIYLDRDAVGRVISLLHASLRMGGFLFLGQSEALSSKQQGFEQISAFWSIYRKIARTVGAQPTFPKRSPVEWKALAQATTQRIEGGSSPRIAEESSQSDWTEALRRSRRDLAASREEMETLNEELRASNAQLNAINDDMLAVNVQLKLKIDELEMQGRILSSGAVMTLFLDEDLRVRWFTPAIVELFPVIQADVGRRITDFVPYFDDRNFSQDVLAVIGGGGPRETEVRTEAKRWFLRRILPHVTTADTGAAVTFTDITELKRAEDALRANEARFRAFAVAGSYVVYRMSPDWQEMYQLEGQSFLADTEANEGWAEDYILPEDMSRVSAAIEQAIRDKAVFELEHRVRRSDGGIGWTLSRAVPILGPEGEIVEWLGTAKDITEQREEEMGRT